MPRQKVTFENQDGMILAGVLETPETSQGTPHYALFAHCFTCGKDIVAASRLSRALAEQGLAVLRFDFTGLGESKGDFATTNFSTNIADLLAAAQFLDQNYRAPSLLIGHSLGGTAVLHATPQIPAAKVVATIGSPSNANHVQQLFRGTVDELEKSHEATLQVGQREFTVRQHMLDDLDQYATDDYIAKLERPLLVFHSPLDKVVPVGEATDIFWAAQHPKSFISLGSADHVLSRREDTDYIARTLVAWSSVYLPVND